MSIDKATVTALMREAQTILTPLFEKNGLATPTIRGSYDTGGEVKLTITGKSPDLAGNEWAKYATGYGLPADALGKEIQVRAVAFRIVGLQPSRRRFPILVENVATGKQMLLTIGTAKRALGLKAESWED